MHKLKFPIHSCGPWEALPANAGVRLIENRWWRIATVEPAEGLSKAEFEANVRLIQNSPLLYDAGKRVVERWSEGDLAGAVNELREILEEIEGE